MPKYRTAELDGALLDAAVANCEGRAPDLRLGPYRLANFEPSTSWADGGPIIERERITVIAMSEAWSATLERSDLYVDTRLPLDARYSDMTGHTATTPLIAAMRAYVASKFGEEVELP